MREHAGTGRAEPYEPYDEPDLLGQYLKQIGRTPLLTAAEEVDLAKRIEAGVYARHLLDEADASAAAPHAPDHAPLTPERRAELETVARDGAEAKDHMLRANLRLVVAAAKKYAHRGWPLLDVIQEGNLGLIRAVEKFDYAKGFKFSTYGMWWIRQAIERGLADKSRTVRLPAHVLERLSAITRMERRLATRLGRDPTDEELAKATDQSVEALVELRRFAHDTVSLDMPIGEDGETRVGDLIADTETIPMTELLEYQALAEELRALIDQLPEREALILTLRYGLNDGRTRTYQEIGGVLGLTRERVRQLERQALGSLRRPERIQPLLTWAS